MSLNLAIARKKFLNAAVSRGKRYSKRISQHGIKNVDELEMIKEAEITEVFSDELINKDVIGWVFLFYLQIFYSTNENF